VRNKHKQAQLAGMTSRNETLPHDVSQSQAEDLIGRLASDPKVTGILVQQPVPPHLDGERLLSLIPVEKDVDGLTTASMGRLLRGLDSLVPCTPLGVLRLLQHYGALTAGKRAVVVGRSTLVGMPLAVLLLVRELTQPSPSHTVRLPTSSRYAARRTSWCRRLVGRAASALSTSSKVHG